MTTALAYKDSGNKAFQSGDYREAEVLYTKACVEATSHYMVAKTCNSIQKDPSNPNFFTNRAFARTKLGSWDPCINDCLKALELQPRNMKGYYYLAQAQLELHHPNEAVVSAQTAYEICLETSNSSTPNTVQLVLRAKKAKWEAGERQRSRQRSEMLRELEVALIKNGAREVEETEDEEEMAEIKSATKRKVDELFSIFALADPAKFERRVRLVNTNFYLKQLTTIRRSQIT